MTKYKSWLRFLAGIIFTIYVVAEILYYVSMGGVDFSFTLVTNLLGPLVVAIGLFCAVPIVSVVGCVIGLIDPIYGVYTFMTEFVFGIYTAQIVITGLFWVFLLIAHLFPRISKFFCILATLAGIGLIAVMAYGSLTHFFTLLPYNYVSVGILTLGALFTTIAYKKPKKD